MKAVKGRFAASACGEGINPPSVRTTRFRQRRHMLESLLPGARAERAKGQISGPRQAMPGRMAAMPRQATGPRVAPEKTASASP